ncbi:hypothetical protein MICRO11B_230179 [Micrococcus luteus]|nr:hypothetical protein MICRO11B_230179 [Micrococcus luteus]
MPGLVLGIGRVESDSAIRRVRPRD